MPCNSGQYREQKTLHLCGICKPLQRPETPDRALVKRVGKRFESARRLSLSGLDKRNMRNEEALGDLPGASLHHRYITEAGVKLSHKLLARNGCRNALEAEVL
jgi:hypothetical protein